MEDKQTIPEKSFYEKEAEVSQKLLIKLAIGERIEELKKGFSGSTDYLSGINDGMYQLMQDLVPMLHRISFAASPQGQWISVEDRLPEEKIREGSNYKYSEWVLVANEHGVFTELGILSGSNWFTSCNSQPEKNVTHWMPLPTKPTTP